MSLWRRIRDAVAGGMRQRVTLAGFGYSLAIAVVCALAFASGNNLLFLLLALMMGMLLVSGFLSRLSLADLELDIAFPDHIPARRAVPGVMKLKNDKTWMPSFSIHVRGTPGSVYSSHLYFPLLAGGGTVQESIQVSFEKRGLHSKNSFLLSSRFPFGFAERRVEVTLGREVLVYPCLDRQPGFEEIFGFLHGEIEEQARGRGTDFYRIRPYEALESARHVDWRASAHTGELQVREFTREQEPLVEVFLDLGVVEGERGFFELAVDCTAYLVWEVSSRGCRVRLRTQDFDVTAPNEGDAYTMLKYLALVEPKRAGKIVEPGREESIQVVFSPHPESVAAHGWHRALLVGLSQLGTSAARGGESPAGPQFDHRH
ncbi:MAG: DUF58 domain-containing protein [Bryobacterales bacterium]|nr:DUF58 domain-containing protein [Bryobacterales bacterium]